MSQLDEEMTPTGELKWPQDINVRDIEGQMYKGMAYK